MIEELRRILMSEAEAITSIPITENTVRAVRAIVGCRGKVFTTGIGKAGYIARKIASTLSTTGSPSVFLHPADASHGDVGAIDTQDILLCFSNSGKTREIIETVAFCRQLGVKTVITITSCKDSPLGRESDIVLELGTITEPCPYGLTPTASTAAMVALGDALALTSMREKGISKEDFAIRHHGGYLGKKSRGEVL